MSSTPKRIASDHRPFWTRNVPSLAARVFIVAGIVALPHGFSAAAGDKTVAAETRAASAPISLAGRWTGPRYTFNMRTPAKQVCAGKHCDLTYDIVSCADGWCGIAVTDEVPCGAIGLRLKQDATHNRRNAFNGKLELAKGAAPYTVEAWYGLAGAASGEAVDLPRLNFVGDTGGELLLMRRSFPFQAELTRVSDAKCTLEMATS